MKISILHPPTLASSKTSLSADYDAGVSSVEVKNTAGAVQYKYLLFGSLGFEQAELVNISSITPPTTIGLATNTKFPHNADDLVTIFDFNQIKIYRSITGISGTYVLQDTLDIDVSDDFTVYEDAMAQSTYYYKFTYLNSQTATETDFSDPIAATGFVFHSLKTMVDRVLSLFGDSKAEFVSRNEVADYINEFYQESQEEYAIVAKRLNLSEQIIQLVSGTFDYDLNTDFLIEKGIDVSEDGGNTWNKKALSQQVDSLGRPDLSGTRKYGYKIINSKIRLDPNPVSNDKVRVNYIASPTTLVLQTDTLSAPFQNRSSMFVKYGLGMCYLKDKNESRFKDLTAMSSDSLTKFLKFISRMQHVHPQYIEQAEY